jgi:hypothetical protein
VLCGSRAQLPCSAFVLLELVVLLPRRHVPPPCCHNRAAAMSLELVAVLSDSVVYAPDCAIVPVCVSRHDLSARVRRLCTLVR